MPEHILGFIRKEDNSGFRTLKSSKKNFEDVVLHGGTIPIISPLEFLEIPNSWTQNSYSKHLPDFLQVCLNENTILLTASEENESDLYSFTYVREKEPHMGRSGVLLKKTSDGFEPIVTWVNDLPFLIEIKGIGSPHGGFLGIHKRAQAGAISGFHIRVTGAMGAEGTSHEYREFEDMDATRKAFPEHNQFLTAGMIHFPLQVKAGELKMGQLIRLIPSTVRLSFTDNPAFDDLNTNQDDIFYHCSSKEVSLFLNSKVPRLHFNINKNNLAYVSEKNYVLTDQEEVEPCDTFYCTLDMQTMIYPAYFSDDIPHVGTHVLAGLSELDTKAKHILKDAKTAKEANDIALRDLIALPAFKQRLSKTYESIGIEDNYDYIKSQMPSSYFTTPLLEWAQDSLHPFVQKRKELVEFYDSFITENGLDIALECWNKTHHNEQRQNTFTETLQDIDPQLYAKWIFRASASDAQDFGKYVSLQTLESLFAEVPPREDKEPIKKRLQSLINMVTSCETIQRTNSLPSLPSQLLNPLDWFNKKEILRFTTEGYLYCYTPFLSVFLHNEKQILEGALYHKNKLSEKETLLAEHSLKLCLEKLTELKKTPEKIHDLVCQGKDAVIAYYKLPYISSSLQD